MLIPPRPYLLSKLLRPIVAPKTVFVFQVPEGVPYWLFGFTAKWYPSVAGDVQTSENLRFRLTPMGAPLVASQTELEPLDPEIGLVTTPAGNGIIRGMVPGAHFCAGGSQIIMDITGMSGGLPAEISVTMFGRCSWLRN